MAAVLLAEVYTALKDPGSLHPLLLIFNELLLLQADGEGEVASLSPLKRCLPLAGVRRQGAEKLIWQILLLTEDSWWLSAQCYEDTSVRIETKVDC